MTSCCNGAGKVRIASVGVYAHGDVINALDPHLIATWEGSAISEKPAGERALIVCSFSNNYLARRVQTRSIELVPKPLSVAPHGQANCIIGSVDESYHFRYVRLLIPAYSPISGHVLAGLHSNCMVRDPPRKGTNFGTAPPFYHGASFIVHRV